MGGKTSAKSKNAYNAKVYDRITLIVPKGKRDDIDQAATAASQSRNAYISEAIDQRMQNDRDKRPAGRSDKPDE